MASVWISKYARWNDETNMFDDMYSDYFTSKAKAIRAAVQDCERMLNTSKIDNVSPNMIAVSTSNKLEKHFWITKRSVQ